MKRANACLKTKTMIQLDMGLFPGVYKLQLVNLVRIIM